MTNIATTLMSAIQRATNDVIDSIAKDGLQIFKNTLDASGFSNSPYLKDYQVFSHVTGDTITFEIRTSADSVIPVDDNARATLDGLQQKIQEIKAMARTYGMSKRGGGVQRVVDARRDARTPPRDATRSTRSALKTSEDRSVEHEEEARSPRNMNVEGGKLVVSFRRSIRHTDKDEFIMPRKEFEGIPGAFIQQLKTLIAKQVNPKLNEIFKRYM